MLDFKLFAGEQVCLAPLDGDKDAPFMAKWTEDSAWVRSFDSKPYLPLSAAQVRKRLEENEKQSAQSGRSVYFGVRTFPQERLIGYAALGGIEPFNGSAQHLHLAIGEADARRKGYGREAITLLLKYAFHEMNLHRLTVRLPAHNRAALEFFRQAGFRLEARRRLAFLRAGRRWDELILGLLRPEWEEMQRRGSVPDPSIPDAAALEGVVPVPARTAGNLSDALLSGSLVRLAAPEQDLSPSLYTAWQRDGEFARMMDTDLARLWSLSHWKEEEEKGLEEDLGTYLLIRTLAGDRPIGFLAMGGMPHIHGDAWLAMGIGESEYRGKGYGEDAMRVAMRYAFEELNLFRVTLNVIAYNQRARRMYRKIGFAEEGCEREFCQRDGQRYDLVYMGLLFNEWSAAQELQRQG